jgi:RHS repeat-associated protein
VTTSGPGGGTDTYGYDAAGNTVSRTKAGVGETLSWDTEGHLASVTKGGQTTSFVYGAGGDRLLRKDPTGTTLYLGKQEVRLAAAGGSPVATRYYTHGGKIIAARQGANLTWLAGDHQSTAQLAIDAQSMTVNRRRQLPFGGPRGAAPAEWPDDHGFVGGVQDSSTGLTHLGAREYDQTTGRFISVDPILDLTDPQQANGYAYANNSPVTSSDPSGLMLSDCEQPGYCKGLDPSTGAPTGGSAPQPPKATGPTRKPTSVAGVGEKGMAEARGQAYDEAVRAKRAGFRTTFSYINIMVQVPDGTTNVGANYNLVPGIIIGLSFSPLPQCVVPSDPQHPVMDIGSLTRAEQAAWDAAHPQPPPKAAPMTAAEFLGAITGADAIVDCVLNPSWGGCAEAAAPFAAGLLGRVVGAGARFFTGAKAVQATAKATDDFVSVFHASVRDSTSIAKNGLDPHGTPTWVSEDINAAKNALTSKGRVDPITDPGIIESRIPRAEFERLLAPNRREYPGWSNDLPGGSTEIVLRKPEQVELFNKYMVH